MSHVVPMDQDKPNKSQPYNSDSCIPYDCSRHLFQLSHYILGIPENSVIFTLTDILIMNKLWKLYWIRAPKGSFTEYGSRNSHYQLHSDFSEYMARAREMVYITTPCSHYWHLRIFPIVAQRLVSQHTRNQSVGKRQQLASCLCLLQITCNPKAS